MRPLTPLWWVLGCAPPPEEYTSREFCALVESLGPEFSSGDVVILRCTADTYDFACADAGAGFLWTDEGRVDEAIRRCTAQALGMLVDRCYNFCTDSGGDAVAQDIITCHLDRSAPY